MWLSSSQSRMGRWGTHAPQKASKSRGRAWTAIERPAKNSHYPPSYQKSTPVHVVNPPFEFYSIFGFFHVAHSGSRRSKFAPIFIGLAKTTVSLTRTTVTHIYQPMDASRQNNVRATMCRVSRGYSWNTESVVYSGRLVGESGSQYGSQTAIQAECLVAVPFGHGWEAMRASHRRRRVY